MSSRVRASELRSDVVEDRVSKLTRELGTATRGKPNGEVRDVDQRIHAFEARFVSTPRRFVTR